MANMSYGGSMGSSYYDLARKGQIFMAQAIITAPVAYTTAAGTGGPLLWNGTGGSTVVGEGPGAVLTSNAQVDAIILGVSWGVTVAETTAGIALGLTGGGGQMAAPTTTTAIDGITSSRINISNIGPKGAGNQCSAYRVGTVATAGNWFLPLASLDTTALTAMPHQPNYVDLAGLIVVPPNGWLSVSASAAGTAAVLQVGLIWAEIPRL